ncbi:hypothetical protein G7074_02285 [Pedobacter sp. HDW13]|uniref:hypothetical protein n=1 Tax=Pedobacter sp. HDW13 TaxID=2714940 RepID=UPI00140AE042|nr:hypothetical protein [Pedobacter sp. HDW13]QIL38205.1 hypothetical protein G7074_02285 [Pedobacter sp. HDW13]
MQTIGVTGHQCFEGISDALWLRQQLQTKVKELKDIELGYSSLAIGADMLFAEVLLAMKIRLVAVIPCMDYDMTFGENDLIQYQFLLNNAGEKIILNFSQPDEEAFFEAGKYVARHSETLFVIWDGQPAKGLGGTGDVFNYAMGQGKSIIHINPWTEETITYNYKQ